MVGELSALISASLMRDVVQSCYLTHTLLWLIVNLRIEEILQVSGGLKLLAVLQFKRRV